MVWWLVGFAASLKRQLQKARSSEREQQRRLLDAYARGYEKYRQRHTQRKRPER